MLDIYTNHAKYTFKCIITCSETTELIVHSKLITAEHTSDIWSASFTMPGSYNEIHRRIHPKVYTPDILLNCTLSCIIVNIPNYTTSFRVQTSFLDGITTFL